MKNCVNSWRTFAVKDKIKVAGDDDKLKEEATEAAYRLNLYRLTIANNAGTAGNGGGVYSSGTFAAVNCTFSGNSAGGQGGAIANEAFAGLNHCTLAANTAGTGAGGIANNWTPFLLDQEVEGKPDTQETTQIPGILKFDNNCHQL